MNRVVVILIIAVVGCSESFGQKVVGKITETGSGEAVQFANVYFASTMIGTTSNPDGTFELKQFPPGKYDLTVSFVGYNTYSKSIEVKKGETVNVTIELVAEVISLPEIYVTADTSNWKQNYRVFRDHFLGTTRASTKAGIINKKKLAFYFDQQDRTLYAHAREPMVIKNEWLGYQITYDMVSFELQYKKGKLAYYGVPRFSYLEPKNKATQRRWDKNRKKEYKGSLLHFFRSMAAGQFEEDEFLVYELFKIPNPNRLPEDVIRERLAYHRNQVKTNPRGSITITGSTLNGVLGDSLSYYARERRKPIYIDSIGRRFRTGKELIEGDYVTFKGILLVVYRGAKEAIEYPFKARSTPSFQESRLHINEKLKLYENGYYEDVRNIFVEGYLSWAGTMASILPTDYAPPND